MRQARNVLKAALFSEKVIHESCLYVIHGKRWFFIMILNLGLETSASKLKKRRFQRKIKCGRLEHRVWRSYSIGTTYINEKSLMILANSVDKEQGSTHQVD